MIETKNREYCHGVDYFKLIASLLVVAMHTELFHDINEKLYIAVDYISRFSVLFFFICSGFFFMKKICSLEDTLSIRKFVTKYVKNLLRPFLIWGSLYSTISIVGDVIIDSQPIKLVLFSKFHQILTESPGGGLWYIYALFWIMLILYIFYKSKKDLFKFLLIFATLYYLKALWGLSVFDGTIISKIKNIYDTIFVSERTFLFHAIFFFIGMVLALSRGLTVNVKKLLCAQVLFYAAYISLEAFQDNWFGVILFQTFRILITVVYFMIAYNLPPNIIRNTFIQKNARKMSTIIYFTHFTAIYAMRFIMKIMHLDYNDHLTIICFICWIVLVLYSVFLLKFDKKYKLVRYLY